MLSIHHSVIAQFNLGVFLALSFCLVWWQNGAPASRASELEYKIYVRIQRCCCCCCWPLQLRLVIHLRCTQLGPNEERHTRPGLTFHIMLIFDHGLLHTWPGNYGYITCMHNMYIWWVDWQRTPRAIVALEALEAEDKIAFGEVYWPGHTQQIILRILEKRKRARCAPAAIAKCRHNILDSDHKWWFFKLHRKKQVFFSFDSLSVSLLGSKPASRTNP